VSPADPLQSIPAERLRHLGGREPRAEGRFVLHWMTAFRRLSHNHALDLSVALARSLGRPLVVLDALRVDYPHASDRLHAFVLQGMAERAAALEGIPGVLHHPYVEPEPGAGRGLVARLAEEACAVVTDDWPCLFHPRMIEAAARQVRVPLYAVDSCGLLPVRLGGKAFARAHDFRRHLQRTLPGVLPGGAPASDPLAGLELPRLDALPEDITRRWPRADDALLAAAPSALARLPIDHEVAPVATPGGEAEARRRLALFLDERLAHYGDNRNDVSVPATSELSAHLHFGQLSTHEILAALARREGWSPSTLVPASHGKREGWWGMSAPAEAYLDQVVTWREVGLNACEYLPGYDRYDSLPAWARQTLAEHAGDRREHLYSREDLEAARTHDELWNAAQNQLRREGAMHNYLRMLWGKKVLEWSASPEEASETLVHLNDRYALDGRDPNSYSGIFWTLGRYDRAWGPERPIFGKIRYMTSDSTRRKMRVDAYVEKYAGGGSQLGLFSAMRRQDSSSGARKA
jgi:deoxyribodipyrimidine photo-lyase